MSEISIRVNPTFDFYLAPKKVKGDLKLKGMDDGEQCAIEVDGTFKQPVSHAESLDMDRLNLPQETHRMDKVRHTFLLLLYL